MAEIKTTCLNCGGYLTLRPPQGMERGTFSARCPFCGSILLFEIKENGQISSQIIKAGEKKKLKKPKIVSRAPPPLSGNKKKGMDIFSLKAARIYLIIAALLFLTHFFFLLYSTVYLKGLEELHPEDSASVAVNVYENATGRGVNRADVVIDDLRIEVRTNNFGHAVIPSVPKGEHRISITSSGYVPIKATIIVRVGVPNVWDFYLSSNQTGQVSKEIPPSATERTYDIMVYVSPGAAVLAVVGAYLVQKRDFFFMAFISSFLSIYGFGFILGSVLASLAAVSIALNYDKFKHLHIVENITKGEGLKKPRVLKAPPSSKGKEESS